MKKILCILLMATLLASNIFAVPAKRGQWRKIRLSDGSEIMAEMRGNETVCYWQTADGSKFIAVDSVYVPADDMSIITRTAICKRQSNRRNATSRSSSLSHIPLIGNKKGLVILVQFSDMSLCDGHDAPLFFKIANENGYNEGKFCGSVSDYFRDQSSGQFNLSFDVVGPVTLPNPYTYYGKDFGGEGNDIRPGQMVAEACKSVDEDVDFSAYDWDNDGIVESVFILYAGKGQADGGDKNTIWPHECELSASDYGKPLELDNVCIDVYACSSELSGNGAISGIGSICHEFSHCLGLPDFYDTVGNNFGMDMWSVMDIGCYNGDGFVPPSYTGYERMFCGWQQPIDLSDVGEQTVTGMMPISENGNTYIIYNKGCKDEFYIIENRQKTGWDAKAPGSGILVTHVDYDADIWYNNTVNNTYNHMRCTIFHADNSSRNAGKAAYPYLGNDSITSNSLPKAKVYNRNIDGSLYMRHDILNMSVDADGTASFLSRPILQGDNTSIKEVHIVSETDNKIYNLDGSFVGTGHPILPSGVYIMNGHKFVK